MGSPKIASGPPSPSAPFHSMRRVVRAGWRDPEDSDEEEFFPSPITARASAPNDEPPFRAFEEMDVDLPGEAPSRAARAISRLRPYKKRVAGGMVCATLLLVVTTSDTGLGNSAKARRLAAGDSSPAASEWSSEWKIGATAAPPPPPENCWVPCGGSGLCPGFCGAGKACCMLAVDSDAECPDHMPKTSYHICVDADPVSPPPPPALVASTASVARPAAPKNCWMACGGSGLCPGFCGHGKACCMRGFEDDADSCPDDRLLPRLTYHTCAVAVPLKPPPPPPPPKIVQPPKPAGAGGAKQPVVPALLSRPPLNCWLRCGGSGLCADFCGAGMACCMMGFGDDDDTCPDVMPKFAYHTCVKADPPSPPPAPKRSLVVKPLAAASKPTAVAAPRPAAVIQAGGAAGKAYLPKTSKADTPPNCWMQCGGSGPCPRFCGKGKACCMMGWEKDDDACPDVMPRYSFHTCVDHDV